MAPEYALWGYLTDKADVYSFGVVLLEIVSGKSNSNYMPSHRFICLLDWVQHLLFLLAVRSVNESSYFKVYTYLLLQACHLQENKSIYELIDERLGSEVDREEVERIVKVAVLCTNATPSIRPTMSEAVKMIEGELAIPDAVGEGDTESRIRAMNDFRKERQNKSSSGGQIEASRMDPGFSSFASEFSEITGDRSS